MFSLPQLGKLSLAVGTAAVAATLAMSAPASARPFHPGFHRGPHYVHGRTFYRGPHFVGRPFRHAYGCAIRRRWVLGTYGWHWAHVRVCF